MGWRCSKSPRARRNRQPRERDPIVILRAANTTSDFPQAARGGREQDPAGALHDREADLSGDRRRRDLTDFKATKLLRVGDFPTLVQYQEDGEIKAGTINEGRETVILGSYGRILRLSRQAIVNDDLGAFDSVFGSIGMVVARFENTLAFAVKAANSGGGPKLADGVNFFHASHGNLAGRARPDVTTLGAGARRDAQAEGPGRQRAQRRAVDHPDRPRHRNHAVQQLLAPIQAQQAATSTRSPARCSTKSTPTSPATAGNSTPTPANCRRSTMVIWPTPRARG
jgi:hypothetical protein